MKKSSTLFLKLILFVVAIVTLFFALLFPQAEGRASGLDLFSIYADPLIIFVYLALVPFFSGLFQAFKLLNLIDANKAFSKNAVTSLKNIKLASMSLIGFILLAIAYIRIFVKGDDSAGPTMLGIIMSLAFATIAVAANIFQKLFQNAIDLKSENDLTI